MATHRSDFGAAITGFIVGGCILFVLLFGVVKATQAKFKAHHTPAGQTH